MGLLLMVNKKCTIFEVFRVFLGDSFLKFCMNCRVLAADIKSSFTSSLVTLDTSLISPDFGHFWGFFQEVCSGASL